MKTIFILLILVSCSSVRPPIHKDYEDQSLLLCSYVLKPMNNGKRGYEYEYKKFSWEDWNWRKESKYIKLDHDSVKKVVILGSKVDNGVANRLISSVYFVNYKDDDNKKFWNQFSSENKLRTDANDISSLKVQGWNALGQDYTYMTDFGLQRIYDSSSCGVSCIRYFLVKNEKDVDSLKNQCKKQIKIFELEGQGHAFVHRESFDNED
jgi:hypothetical protein